MQGEREDNSERRGLLVYIIQRPSRNTKPNTEDTIVRSIV